MRAISPRRRPLCLVAILMVWGGGVPASAWAQTVYPTMEGVVPIEVEIDRNY